MTLLQIRGLEAQLQRRDARIAELEAQLEAIGAGGVNGPLMTPTPPPAERQTFALRLRGTYEPKELSYRGMVR